MAVDPHTQAPASSSGKTPNATRDGVTSEPHSYGQILKSSVLIGGSSLVSVAVGIVRTKAMALLLGPGGFGLLGLYGSIVDLALSIASFGVSNSGVRQIAESVGTNDEARIARTVVVLRRTTLVLGVFGLLLVVVFSGQIAVLAFDNDAYAVPVALLGLAVLFRVLSAGQGALIQGMRRIRDLAAMGALGALLGALASIGLVLLLGEQGISPSIVASAAVGFAISWWYSRKVEIRLPRMTHAEVTQEAAALLKLGFAFMASGMLMMGAALAVRTIVLRMDGLDAAGFYSAAWTLGGLYVGIILQAMGADFYPRLVGAAQDDRLCNRLVNEQTQISLLLAGPGVIATITLAPLILWVLYSAAFAEAVDVLRWICLGIALRVITWPMGFIIVAKNRQALFMGVDLAWAVVNVGLTWICVSAFGLSGAGIAFLGSYVFHAVLIYPLVHWLTGFRWSPVNLRTGAVFIVSMAVVYGSFWILPAVLAYGLGMTMTLASGIYSLKTIANLTDWDRVPRQVQRVLTIFRLAPARSR